MSARFLFQHMLVCAAGLFALGPAQAAVINYTESVSGDLGGSPSTSTNVGTFDSGVNTVGGQASFSSDDDYFHFSVPFGLSLLSVSLDHLWALDAGTTYGSFQPDLRDNTGTLISDGGVVNSSMSSPWSLFGADLPKGSGVFYLYDPVHSAVHHTGTTGGWTLTYQWNFTVGVPTVAKAPEPAALALFGFGLAGLGYLRRKRRA